jgi:tetratricopeptide (TPR) repeat protein
MARPRPPRLIPALLLLPLLLAPAPAPAQSPPATAETPSTAPAAPAPEAAEPAPEASADRRQAPEAEVMRARIQARLGMVEEAIAGYRALLERYPEDRSVREEYAETLVDAGLVDQAAPLVDRYLAEDPTSARLRRLRTRLDLAAAAAGRGARRLETIAREQVREPGLAADVAAAELAAGRWTRALELYGQVIEGDPDNRDVRTAYREILFGHAPRIELSHYTLLQQSATHHVEEAAWRGWLADRWWLRAGVRYGSYHQRRVRGTDGAVSQTAFSEQIETALATVGFLPTPRWTVWAGLEESARREEIFRTTGRLGAGYDDGKATVGALEIAARELLTNPVAAIPRNGTTDRVTLDVARRVLVPVVLAAHYDFRHYRASAEDLGHRWEAAARAELELVRSRVQVTLIPQVFFSEYTPTVGSPLRDTVTFLRREDIIGIGAVVGWDVTSALRLQAGSVGRRDLHRELTSWEVTGEARWRIRPWLEGRVLYTRNTESTTIGGQEESFLGRLDVLY